MTTQDNTIYNAPDYSYTPNAEGRNNDATEDNDNSTYSNGDDTLSGGNQIEEIANNDGSITETLDTAFHNQPGFIDGHSPAGSNRADYYEKRSQGQSDTDEETEYLKNKKAE